MTDTALIGSSCALGVFWSSKRYFDYLIDETNLSLLRGKEFGQAVIICPSLREGGAAIRRNTAPFLAQVKTLIDILHEVKAERVTYITSIDTQPETGNELSPLLRKPEGEWLMALVELKDFINLRFGRVLNVCLPEVTGTGAGMSVADLLAAVPEGTEELDVALLERHQLYPMHRLVRDVEKAWECGIFSVNLVPEPVTVFELVEQCFPSLVSRLPVAKETDPYGSARTSVYSTQYHDPDTGYIMDKEDVLAGLSNKKLISVEASQGVSLLRSAEEEESHDHEAVHADEDEEDSHDHGTAHADEDGHDHADEEDAAVSNAAAHEDDAADHTVVAAPDGHDAHEHGEYDPHVWLDPMNAKQEMQNICEAFSEADPEHRADYQANYEKWEKQLDELDKTYQTTLENLSERNIVVAHEAYGYLCRRYNLTQVSIEGMSPDSEPDPGRMADIIDFVRANNVRAIFFEELSGSRTAETVAAETGVKLLTLSPLEGLSDRQEETGGDYFSVMEENLQQLTEALR